MRARNLCVPAATARALRLRRARRKDAGLRAVRRVQSRQVGDQADDEHAGLIIGERRRTQKPERELAHAVVIKPRLQPLDPDTRATCEFEWQVFAGEARLDPARVLKAE